MTSVASNDGICPYRVTANALLFIGLISCFSLATGDACAQIQLPAYGYIGTVSGNGTRGYSGDGGQATNAALNSPSGVAVDGAGNIYIADSGNERIRKVTASTGIISTVAGNGTGGYSGDGGSATSAELNSPSGVAVDAFGNIYIADYYNYRVRVVYSSGTIPNVSNPTAGSIYTVAGDGTPGYSGDGGLATSAMIGPPWRITLDASGNIYIALYATVRKVNASTGTISTVAGNGTAGFSGDNGPATAAELRNAWAVSVDGYGNIFIADEYNERIREVTASTGIINTVAGTGLEGYNGDGEEAIAAELSNPGGVAVDESGNFYIGDGLNHRIRKVTNGVISTLAGKRVF